MRTPTQAAQPPTQHRAPTTSAPAPDQAPVSNQERQGQLQEEGSLAPTGVLGAASGPLEWLWDWLVGEDEEGAICDAGDLQSSLATALSRAQRLAETMSRSSRSREALELLETVRGLKRAVDRAGTPLEIGCDVAEIARKIDEAERVWAELREHPGDLEAQRNAADHAGSVFGALGELMADSGVPGVEQYGELLQGFDGDFFYNLAVNISRTDHRDFRRGGVRLSDTPEIALPYRGLPPR